MTFQVRPLTKRQIEGESVRLLSEYRDTLGDKVKSPIPVEDIVTSHLAMDLEFADLHAAFEIPMQGDEPRILGALSVALEVVLIDHRLDPSEHPWRVEQFRFTVAHEVGHWILHRDQACARQDEASPTDVSPGSRGVFRPVLKKGLSESQADQFAACLLMPRDYVEDCIDSHCDQWNDFLWFPLQGEIAMVRARAKRLKREHRLSDIEAMFEAKYELGAKPLAKEFAVPIPAMRRRLEDLGLISRKLEVSYSSNADDWGPLWEKWRSAG